MPAALTATEIRKLLTEKCPPQDDTQRVYASIILAQAENLDRLNKQTAELIAAAKFLADMLRKMNMPAAPVEEAAQQSSPEDTGPRDQTPFPAGAKVQAGAPTTPATLDETQAVAAQSIPTPDTVSGPAVNAAPIPKAPKAKNGNGAKDGTSQP